MLKYDNTVSSQVDGKPIYGAQVAVYTADTDTPALATIFADEAGTTPLSQPILTDQLGYFAFYIGDGKYNIRVMTGAVEISRTNITMVDTLQLKQRALIVPVNEDGGTLPPADQRQGKLLGFDAGGNPTMAVPNSFSGPTGPANSTYASINAIRTQAAPTNLSAILISPGNREIYGWTPGVVVTTDSVAAIGSNIDPTGSWRRIDGPLFAGNFGVVGDASSDANGNVTGTDDTAAVQAFQTLCASLNRIAYYGSLRPRLTGPIKVHNGSCVFDRQSFTASGEGPGVSRGEPGFYVSGSGYTAVTVTGICTAFCATVVGGGDATTDAAGNITADTRPRIHGIQFGNPLGASDGTILLSHIGWARATKLSGCGIRTTNAFDCRFSAQSVEACGNADDYALSIEDGGNTTNESVFEYIQSEFGKQKALYISPNTLSSTFLKIHSERATGKDGVPTWVFGGGAFHSVRISLINSAGYALCRTQAADHTSFRAEGVPVQVDSSGGQITFHTTENGTFSPSPNSNGVVNFFGGLVNWSSAMSGWSASKATMQSVTVGFCPDGTWPVLDHCNVGSLARTDDSAAIEICGGRVGRKDGDTVVGGLSSGQWRDIRITTNARVYLAGGVQRFALCKMLLDQSSKMIGNLVTNSVGFRHAGRIEGDFNQESPRQTLHAPSAEATGGMNNVGPPEGDSYLDGAPSGSFSKNMRPSVQGTAGSQYIVSGYMRVGTTWTEMRTLTGT